MTTFSELSSYTTSHCFSNASSRHARLADAVGWALDPGRGLPRMRNGSHARAVIDGLRCGGVEPSGWDAVVAPRLEPEDLTLLDGISLAISSARLAL